MGSSPSGELLPVGSPVEVEAAPAGSRRWGWKFAAVLFLGVLASVVLVLLVREMQGSRWQARWFSSIDQRVSFHVAAGPNPSIRFPEDGGPYDERMGYAQLRDFTARLDSQGFAVTAQARQSPEMQSLAARGLYVPYAEKDQAGLELLDDNGIPLYSGKYPQHIYSSFDEIPPVLARSLSFIEDRDLLDAAHPFRNPAIDWGRFTLAGTEHLVFPFLGRARSPGGSTLVTQIEKFRHSPGGRTGSPTEKLRQMASGSLAAYMGGEQTLPSREHILVQYLNTEPLAAHRGDGEIAGIGDGLAAWYGRDFSEVNRLLRAIPPDARTAAAQAAVSPAQALAFKQALSLLIAQRAPSHYLEQDDAALDQLTDSYVRLLAAGDVIPASLRDRALAERLHVRHGQPVTSTSSHVDMKAASLLRAQLMATLGLATPYDLDRLDLSVRSSIVDRVQQAVTAGLQRARTVAGARDAGLFGFEMLRPGDDPSKIVYSFNLFERGPDGNVLRIQTDSLNQQFDLNQGARLNLGSTAKLRTVILYLQIVSGLHDRYAPLSAVQLARVKRDPLDALAGWALEYLAHTPDRSLPAMLQAAVERTYSADPTEVFATGGGEQTFNNFESSDNDRILTVHEAFQRSVNLVFVRLMRDIVHHEMVAQAGASERWLTDPALRNKYLTQFADEESLTFLQRFESKYRDLPRDQVLARLTSSVARTPLRMAAALRSVAPDASLAWFEAEMRKDLKGTPGALMSDAELAQLHDKYGPDKFDLNDRAYLAKVHPVELWLVNYLRSHPHASSTELRQASRQVRIGSYAWLFKTRNRATQDRRILELVERNAYGPILASWRALGYPFATMTTSYGSAVGAAGDRPVALAKLMGILAGNGRLESTSDIRSLTFAAGTPYETRFQHVAGAGRAVLSPPLVGVVRGLLRDVVVAGTGKRLANGLPLRDGHTLPVYGKTGTGDQRLNVYARSGALIESRKINRTATFVFLVGDRFYGSLTAYTHQPYAARYTYTSAMAVQLLKSLGPALTPVLEEAGAPDASSGAGGNLR